MSNHFIHKVLPVVVLYNQSITESLTLNSLIAQDLDHGSPLEVYVYDNSTQAQFDKASFIWKSLKIIYRHDSSNPGLSKAYNSAADLAVSLNKTWIMLLDQDTTFPLSFFKEIEVAVNQQPNFRLFAPTLKLKDGTIFSPCIARHKRGYPPKVQAFGENSLWELSPVNSGMLIKLELFQKAGGYNEKIKVDFCDFQFLEKVRKIDPRFYVVNMVGIQDFSGSVPDKVKQKKRFLQYLDDAFNCDKPTFVDSFGFFYTVSRHAVALAVKTRSFSYISLFFSRYLLK